jgi:DNA-binding NtrC family response regulator
VKNMTIRAVCIHEHPCYLLIVDDNPHVVEVLKSIFVPETNILVVVATTLAEALLAIKRLKDQLEVILLDLGLTDSEGIKTLDIVFRACKGRIAIIPVTGSLDLEDEAFKHHAQDFFGKPLDNIDVVTRVKYAILRQREKNKASENEEKLAIVEKALANPQGAQNGTALELLREVRTSLQEITRPK